MPKENLLARTDLRRKLIQLCFNSENDLNKADIAQTLHEIEGQYLSSVQLKSHEEE